MFQFLIAFFIFCIILFIYLHVIFHYKTSNDLEVFEVESLSKEKLEEICDLRQPVIFDFVNDVENGYKILDNSNTEYLLNNYHAFEMKIRNTKENYDESEMYIPLTLESSIKLCNEDKTSSYFTEKNNDFLQESGIVKHFQYNDSFLRPYLVSNCNYDILFGSDNTTTPFRYELNYRNYFLVTEGSIRIKLAPPKSSKYLFTVYDYENYEFRSPVDPWEPQKLYMADFDKIKCLDIELKKGQILQIPAYWWYSIKFEKKSCISTFFYKTYMNNVANMPHILMYFLQIQNIKRESYKKKDIQDLNKKGKENLDIEIKPEPKEEEEIEKNKEDK